MVNAFRLMIFVLGLAVVIGSIMVTSGAIDLAIYSPSNGDTVYTDTITVSGGAMGTDGAVVESVTVNGLLADGTTSWLIDISLQPGPNTITAVANDMSGMRAIATIFVAYIEAPLSTPTTIPIGDHRPTPTPTTPTTPVPTGDHRPTPAPIPTPIPTPTGSISITTTPPGAEVYLDNSDVSKGIAPITLENVPEGPHEVTVKKEGYHSQTRDISIYTGKIRELNIELKPITGSVIVYSTPSGASVYLDDVDMNKITPCVLSEVVVGSHTIQLRKSGYSDIIRMVSVSVGRTARLYVNLTGSPRYGSLDISSDPSGAKVYLNDVYTNDTPCMLSEVVVGQHTIKLTKSDYDDVIRNVSVSVGETRQLHENLTGYGSLDISSDPSGANVSVDGDYTGKTPLLTGKLVEGWYRIKLTKQDYVDVEKMIPVSAGITTCVDETLSVQGAVNISTIAVLMVIIISIIGVLIFIIKVKVPRRKRSASSKWIVNVEDVKPHVESRQKIDFAKRKDIILLNSQEWIKHKDYAKINPLYEKAQELEKRGENKESIETYEKIIDINEYYKKAWEGLERNYNALGESEKRDSASKKIRSITEFVDFATNAAQKITLQQFELQNLDFFDNLFWSFQPQINILLGKNGYGKTYLLRLLISILQKDDDISSEFFEGKKSKYLFSWDNVPRGDINRLLRFLVDDLNIDWAENAEIHKSDDGKTIRIFKDVNSAEITIDEEREKATLKISDGRSHGLKVRKEKGKLNIYTTNFVSCDLERNNVEKVIYRTKTVFEQSMGKVPVLAIPDMRLVDKSKTKIEPVILETDIRESGAYHFLYEKPFEEVIQNFLYELCIRYINKGKSFEQPLFQLLHKVVRELTDKKFEFDEIVAIGSAKFEIKVITEGNKEKPLPLQKASQGTLSILSIFGLIYYYLASVFPDTPEEELLKKPAIVFIDEVDAHLHPSWQQRIMGLLRDSFPNVQFIVTAHSPLVVAGCYENEVAVLRKEKNGFTIENIEEHFIGTSASEIYKRISEIDDKIDENYLKYATLSSMKKDNSARINKLEVQSTLSAAEQEELDRLYKEDYYVSQIAEIKMEKEEKENSCEKEIKVLQEEIRELKSKSKEEPKE